VLLPLVAGMVWLGLYPKPVLDRMDSAAKRYVQLAQPGFDQRRTTALTGAAEERP